MYLIGDKDYHQSAFPIIDVEAEVCSHTRLRVDHLHIKEDKKPIVNKQTKKTNNQANKKKTIKRTKKQANKQTNKNKTNKQTEENKQTKKQNKHQPEGLELQAGHEV